MKAIEVHADRRLGGARLGSLLAIAAAVLALGIGTLARIGPAGESASGLSAGDLDRTFRGDLPKRRDGLVQDTDWISRVRHARRWLLRHARVDHPNLERLGGTAQAPVVHEHPVGVDPPGGCEMDRVERSDGPRGQLGRPEKAIAHVNEETRFQKPGDPRATVPRDAGATRPAFRRGGRRVEPAQR